MFSSPLPDELDYRIFFSDHAQRHFIKSFQKKYKGKRWLVTMDSIFQDLKRIHSMQMSQQVDELKHGKDCKLFKYDFAIAQSGVSPKASGNRCVVFLDTTAHRQDVLMLYTKTDLPKNVAETTYILQMVQDVFPQFWSKLNEK